MELFKSMSKCIKAFMMLPSHTWWFGFLSCQLLGLVLVLIFFLMAPEQGIDILEGNIESYEKSIDYHQPIADDSGAANASAAEGLINQANESILEAKQKIADFTNSRVAAIKIGTSFSAWGLFFAAWRTYLFKMWYIDQIDEQEIQDRSNSWDGCISSWGREGSKFVTTSIFKTFAALSAVIFILALLLNPGARNLDTYLTIFTACYSSVLVLMTIFVTLSLLDYDFSGSPLLARVTLAGYRKIEREHNSDYHDETSAVRIEQPQDGAAADEMSRLRELISELLQDDSSQSSHRDAAEISGLLQSDESMSGSGSPTESPDSDTFTGTSTEHDDTVYRSSYESCHSQRSIDTHSYYTGDSSFSSRSSIEESSGESSGVETGTHDYSNSEGSTLIQGVPRTLRRLLEQIGHLERS